MGIYTFNFDGIENQENFHRDLNQTLDPIEGKIRDLNSLWDVLMNDVLPLPLEVEFVHLGEEARRRFDMLVLLFDKAEEELGGHLHFNVHHQHKEDPRTGGSIVGQDSKGLFI